MKQGQKTKRGEKAVVCSSVMGVPRGTGGTVGCTPDRTLPVCVFVSAKKKRNKNESGIPCEPGLSASVWMEAAEDEQARATAIESVQSAE